MREIRFRSWDKINQQMNCCSFSVYKDGRVFNEDDKDITENVELMQWTGLLDIHKKLIFEGDIVKHENGVKKVYWDNSLGAWQMNLSNNVNDQEALAYTSYKIEIIGNIYENKDLL